MWFLLCCSLFPYFLGSIPVLIHETRFGAKIMPFKLCVCSDDEQIRQALNLTFSISVITVCILFLRDS
jgi:hypothetical protein